MGPGEGQGNQSVTEEPGMGEREWPEEGVQPELEGPDISQLGREGLKAPSPQGPSPLGTV